MPRNRIVELATRIAQRTEEIDAHLESLQLPTPSFDESAPPKLEVPPHVHALQESVLESCDELTALLQGPARAVASQPHNSWVSVQAIQRFGLANAFAVGETSTFDAIAQTCELPVDDVRRLLRHAMTFRIFRESSPGVVAHTAASKVLAQIPPLGLLVGFLSGEMWPSATRIVDALERWPGSEEPHQAGYALAFHTDQAIFDAVGRDEARARRMAGAMSFTHSGPANHVRHLLENFDWGHAATGTIVDVGGADGSVAAEVARFLPSTKCIVQDLAAVVASVEVPDDLREGNRLTFVEHDFFQEQPVKADVFLLRWVLHDWSDKYAVQILQNLRPGLQNGARVVVSELCLPPPCTLSPYRERQARMFDIAMKGIQNAKERDADDWLKLFRQADPRFRLLPIQTPEGSNLSIISAVWQGD